MRRIKATVIAALATCLLAGSAVGVVAQEASPDPSSMAYATGTFGEPGEILEGSVAEAPDGSRQLRDIRFSDIRAEFTDPRLSGLLTIASNGAERETADGFARLDTRTYRIVNDDGAWAGSGLRVAAIGAEPEPLINHESMVLVGEGAYEGLVAFLLGEITDEGPGYRAIILATEMVPTPEAITD